MPKRLLFMALAGLLLQCSKRPTFAGLSPEQRELVITDYLQLERQLMHEASITAEPYYALISAPCDTSNLSDSLIRAQTIAIRRLDSLCKSHKARMALLRSKEEEIRKSEIQLDSVGYYLGAIRSDLGIFNAIVSIAAEEFPVRSKKYGFKVAWESFRRDAIMASPILDRIRGSKVGVAHFLQIPSDSEADSLLRAGLRGLDSLVQ